MKSDPCLIPYIKFRWAKSLNIKSKILKSKKKWTFFFLGRERFLKQDIYTKYVKDEINKFGYIEIKNIFCLSKDTSKKMKR